MKSHPLTAIITITAHIGAGAALALPSPAQERDIYDPCPTGLYNRAYCCSLDPLGYPIDCSTPQITPLSGSDFQNICAWSGMYAECCVIPIPDYSWFLCVTPIGLSPYDK